jgi:hypothetical protein
MIVKKKIDREVFDGFTCSQTPPPDYENKKLLEQQIAYFQAGRQANYCWPSPAEPFLVPSPSEPLLLSQCRSYFTADGLPPVSSSWP